MKKILIILSVLLIFSCGKESDAKFSGTYSMGGSTTVEPIMYLLLMLSIKNILKHG